MNIFSAKPRARLTLAARLVICGTASAALTPAHADFLKDSKSTLDLRNYYFNRDFRQSGVPQSKAEEWAQGFILRAESGYTEGLIGFGLDASALVGVKLDSAPDRTGTGLLNTARGPGGRAEDSYGELGLTGKMRLARSTLKVGTLLPKMPVVLYNDSRLLPQTFRGAWLNSADIDQLSLDLGRLDQTNLRNSSDNEDMSVYNGVARNIRLGRHATSDRFDFAGATYRWTPALSTAYHYGELEGIYRQHYLTLNHKWVPAEGHTINSDLRWARSLDEGGSNVDNSALGAMFSYNASGHTLGFGYQRMSGDTGFANLNGTDGYLVNLVQINDFGNQDERSWQARYDYNFAAVGIPGLTFMTRYLSGDNVTVRGRSDQGKEWERDSELAYVIQSGPLKNLGLKWKNASARSNFSSDIDENRLIVTYAVAFW